MRTREFTGAPSGKKKLILVADIPKIYCPVCHENMTIQSVADFLDVSWNVIRDIDQNYPEKHFS